MKLSESEVAIINRKRELEAAKDLGWNQALLELEARLQTMEVLNDRTLKTDILSHIEGLKRAVRP